MNTKPPVNPRTLELAESLLVLSNDEDGIPYRSITDIYQAHLERLTDEFYHWLDQLNEPMIEAGLGDKCADDLWPRIEYYYLAVRLGHGLSFKDAYVGGPEYNLSALADNLAKKQTYLEDGAYIGDDDIIYVYAYH